MNDVDLLCLRCSKFPLKALRERDSIQSTLLTTGWSADLIKEHLDEAIQFAEDARRAWLKERRDRRRRERELDREFDAQNVRRVDGYVQAAA